MSAATNDKAYRCVFKWKIENVSNCWWMKKEERIESPPFIANGLEGTKWSLILLPRGFVDEENIGLFLRREADCSGPEIFVVNLQVALLGKDGSILKERTRHNRVFVNGNDWGVSLLETQKRVFVTDREAFIREDTLLVQCTLWDTDEKLDASDFMFATTVIKVKRRSLEWKIDKNSALESENSYKFIDYLICFHATFNLGKLCLNMTSFHHDIKYISCNTYVLNSEGKKENCGIEKYFANDLKCGVSSGVLLFPETETGDKSRFFSNDALYFYFELVISTFEHFSCSKNSSKIENKEFEKIASLNASILIDDMKSLYENDILSDTNIRTLTKSFKAHKNILSARSPFFRNIFSNDMNKNNGHVDITDFDDDTVQRMLLYMYTDSLENMQCERACKLYAIANAYQIPSLKGKCSRFLVDNLCPTNASKVLVLSILHQDDDLKCSVEDYILGQRGQFFHSQEWKEFTENHVEIAADIMRRKIVKNETLLM